MGRNFISDHVAPACDAIMSAVAKANEGYAASYGGDELTAKLRKDVERAVRTGKISPSESKQLLRFYEEGLTGYTYLEEP